MNSFPLLVRFKSSEFALIVDSQEDEFYCLGLMSHSVVLRDDWAILCNSPHHCMS